MVAGTVRAIWSDSSDGDLHPEHDGGLALSSFADAVIGVGGPRPSWVHQVHGSAVEVVEGPPGGTILPVPADALISADPSVRLSVLTADCASVAMASEDGMMAAVHAGWRGLLGGVVEATATTMRRVGASSLHGALGPCIHPECYEFSPTDLAVMADRFGAQVRSETSTGLPALDLPAAVAAALDGVGVEWVGGVDACTACSERERYYSHRARRDTARQALVVWSEAR